MLDHRLGDGPVSDVLAAAGKAAPPIAVSAAAADGVTLQDWVLIMTLVYTVLQIAWLIYKAWRNHRPGGRYADLDE